MVLDHSEMACTSTDFHAFCAAMNAIDLSSLLHPRVPAWSLRQRRASFSLSPFWRGWLLDQTSLTARLTALGNFRVELLRSYRGHATQLEQQRLHLPHNAGAWIREVRLYVDDAPLVYARTLVPQRTLQGGYQHLQYLGQQSLGRYLFSQPNLSRGPFGVIRCHSNPLSLEWCRYSVFYLGHQPLMVSEAFTNQLHRHYCG